jgi:hypothetical protein
MGFHSRQKNIDGLVGIITTAALNLPGHSR